MMATTRFPPAPSNVVVEDTPKGPVIPEIEQLVPYVPGKPIDELKRELGLTRAIKLASNENPLGPSPHAVAAMRDALEEVNLYPDGGAFYLKEKIAEHLGVDASEVVTTNGSNEAIELIVRTFRRPGCRAVVSDHSFIVYKMASMCEQVAVDEIPMTEALEFDLEAMGDAVRPDTRFVFLANPNNPTGTWFDRASLVRLLDRLHDDVIVVLDEAYFEYVDDARYPNGVELWREYPNLVVLRTFSKAYGLAGVRLGYGVIRADLNRYLDRVRAPFNTNMLAQRAGIAALDDTDYLRRSVEHNRQGLEQLRTGLVELGMRVFDSATNFVLFDAGRSCIDVYHALLERGVIVRPMAGYGLATHVRVSVGLESENQEFLTALAAVLESSSGRPR